jgi:hypothetical protein
MSLSDNRKIEQHYFELFRLRYELPAGRLEYTDKPDVILHGERCLGIEIANLYIADGSDSTSEQVQRRRRKQVLARAQALHREAGGRCIALWVTFNPGHPVQVIEPLAVKLAEIAMRIESSPGRVDSLTFLHVPELHLLYHSGEEYENAEWQDNPLHAGSILSTERVRAMVAVKSAKALGYNKNCDAYWLLLVVDFMDSAQDQSIEWPEGTMLAKSPFEQIMIYKPQFDEVVQVQQAAA